MNVSSDDKLPCVITRKQLEAMSVGALLQQVWDNGLVLVRDFPIYPNVMLNFARQMGNPQRRYLEDPEPSLENVFAWITDVRFVPEPDGSEPRKFGYRSSSLDLHTARASSATDIDEIPRLFMMLMVDPGVSSDAKSGQSRFSRLEDAVANLKKDHSDQVVQDIFTSLQTTDIPLPDSHLETQIGPLLYRFGTDVDHMLKFRYWEGIKDDASETDIGYQLEVFDKALVLAQLEFSMQAGDLVLIDNHRVAHGRHAFTQFETTAEGEREPSSRLLLNLHIFVD